MSEINRSLVILRPKQPFLDWGVALDDKNFTLEQLAEDSTAYLIPELWDDSDQEELLESYCDVLFEEQLLATHPRVRPKCTLQGGLL